MLRDLTKPCPDGWYVIPSYGRPTADEAFDLMEKSLPILTYNDHDDWFKVITESDWSAYFGTLIACVFGKADCRWRPIKRPKAY